MSSTVFLKLACIHNYMHEEGKLLWKLFCIYFLLYISPIFVFGHSSLILHVYIYQLRCNATVYTHCICVAWVLEFVTVIY